MVKMGDKMAGLLIKDIASESGLNESTIRFYRQKFPEFFYFNLEGKRKKYAPEVVEIVKFISECYDQKWDSEDIRAALVKKYNQVHDVQPIEKPQEVQQYPNLDMELFREMLAQYMTQMEQRVKEAEEKAVKAQEKADRIELENEKMQERYDRLIGFYVRQNAIELHLERKVVELKDQLQETTQCLAESDQEIARIDQKLTAWRMAVAARGEKKPWWKFWGK